MAPRTTYANLADGLSPLSQWDASLADMGKLGTTPCTAAGTNAIVLTPIAAVFAPTVTTPQQNQQFSFVATANSSGAVTVQVGSLSAKTLFRGDGVTQATTGDIVLGVTYVISYNGTSFQLPGSTVTGLTTANFAANVVDADGTLGANSDARLATQKATKTYVDLSARTGRAVYETVAVATAATIPTSVTSIIIVRYAAGYQASYATYIPGTISGPMAFLEAGGHYWQLDLTGGTIDPRWFGAKADGINDDTTALQAALTQALGGKQLVLPAGTLGISSSLSGGAGNVSIIGEGNNRSIIQVLGSSSLDPLLQFTDASDVTIDGVSFLGNNITVGVGAFLFNATTGSGAIGRYTIRNCRFSNFKASYWIRLLTSTGSISQTRSIRYVRIQNNDFFSLSGNAPNFSSIGVPANMIDLQGSVDNNASIVDDVIISGNYADCGNIKCFSSSWAGANNVLISDNFILNAGSAGVNDRGCYGILVYNNQGSADVTYSPTDITIKGNTIISARSMGVYAATTTRLQVVGNKISGVQDTTAASLPYAAISLGQCADSRVLGNDLVDNYVAIQLIPTPASITAEASGNRIRSSVNSAQGIISTTLSSFVNKIKMADNTILLPGTTTNGITCNSGGVGAEFDTVEIYNNRVQATTNCITCLNSSGGGIKANLVTLDGNTIDGAFTGIGMEVEQSSARLVLRNNTINLVSAGAAALGIKLDSSTVIQIDGLMLLNRTTGVAFAYSASSALGTIRNVVFSNIARANLPADASGHLGFQIPTFSGLISWFVQNLSTTFYVEAGAAASKYTVDGWVNTSGSTTWLPKRLLTGN